MKSSPPRLDPDGKVDHLDHSQLRFEDRMATTRPQPAMQRAASLMALPALLDDLGASLPAVLEGTGIALADIRPDSFVPYAAFLAALDNASRATARDDLGILLGKRQTLATLGPLGDVLRHAATLGEAISDFAAFQGRNSTGGAVYFMRADRDVILGYAVYDPTARVSPQIYDLVVAVGCNLIAELTGGAVAPDEILLSRCEPEDPVPYHRLGRCPVRFDQHQTGVLLRASTLDLALPEADKALHDRALTRMLAAPEGGPLPLVTLVRHILRPLLLVGHSGMEVVADRVGLHPRTMRRQLRREGTSFETIKAEVRMAAARDLLRLGGLSISDISATLDYATPSAFVNAFRRWEATSPGLWRRANRTR
jgi:AraC-like DNA-binding protein